MKEADEAAEEYVEADEDEEDEDEEEIEYVNEDEVDLGEVRASCLSFLSVARAKLDRDFLYARFI